MMRIATLKATFWTLVTVALIAASPGCDEASGTDSDTNVSDTADTADTTPDTADVVDTTDTTDTVDETGQIEVTPTACCLSMVGDDVIWADDGDLWHLHAETRVKTALVDHAATQKDPAFAVLEDGRKVLVWSDDRDGDFDLWTMDLPDGEPALLHGADGDQDQASVAANGVVVWISTEKLPRTARDAEVWMMRLGVADSAVALTDDACEQQTPHTDGQRVVWTDFRNSVEGTYLEFSDPMLNNADIYGWDLSAEVGFVVSDNPSKQLRPAIEGDAVVWLDWRGVNPEPKYSAFLVYGKRLDEAEGHLVAESQWDAPELWQRPAIHDGVVAWIAEPGPGDAFKTGVYARNLDGGDAWLVVESAGVLEAVVLDGERAAWLGGGKLGLKKIQAQQAQ
jgi:hypothetical protein